MEDFKVLTVEEEKKLTKEELINYYKGLKHYYEYRKEEYKTKPIKHNIVATKILHPLVKILMRTTRNFKIEILHKEKLQTNQPTIYAVNHSNSHDIPTICEVVPKHFFLLLGVQNLRIIDRAVFKMNGTVYVDRKNKINRNESKEEMVQLVAKGQNLLIFPEGTWNLSPNALLLPLNWGLIEIAKKTGAAIKPISLEYYDKKCYVNVGDDIFVDVSDNQIDKIEELKESLSTLKWEVMEKFPAVARDDIRQEDLDKYTIDRCQEYPSLNPEYEQSIIRKPYDTEEEVYKFLNSITLDLDNSFLAKAKQDYKERYKK